MRAVGLRKFGGPEVLEILELPDPVPQEDEILIQVEASGVNRADTLIREGRYSAHRELPVVPGFEVAGKVKAVGSAVTKFKTGQSVFAILMIGGYAEQVVVQENLALPIPENLNPPEAAGIPDVFLTAWVTLFKKANLREGEKVLIHAAGSGIGMAAIQLAKSAGAVVFTTASSNEKLDKAKALGADFSINYTKASFAEEIKKITAGEGVKVILDGVGASTLDGNLQALSQFGRLILIGTVGGREAQFHLGRAITKNVTIFSFRLHGHSEKQLACLYQDFGREISPLFKEGKLRSIVDKTFSFEQAEEAHLYLEQRKNFGKVILKP
jgi:putative PIG3 family NAD(P)H quinone oxidoreductase